MRIIHPNKEQRTRLDVLANRIFLNSREGESMAAWFPGLYDEKNKNHIFAAQEKGALVTTLNWYDAMVKIGPALLSTGYIGGVCSDEAVRGKGYASKILIEVFQQMKREHISVCFISGDRNLYTRHGACIIGKRYDVRFQEGERCSRVKHLGPDELKKGASAVFGIHNLEDVCFVRSMRHTVEILEGISTHHHGMRGELYYTPQAYVVVKRPGRDGDLYFFDYAGKPDQVCSVIKHIIYENGCGMQGIVYQGDEALLDFAQRAVCGPMCGTVKIINAPLLFSQLGDLFCFAGLKDVSVFKANEKWVIRCGKTRATITEENLHYLVFGKNEISNIHQLFEEKKAPQGLEKVFPLRLPHIAGLDSV